MGEFLGRLAQEILDLFKKNYRQPRLWFVTISIVIILWMILPYIDSNFFYYTRMEKRINILEQVMKLDENKIEGNPVYKHEYNSILKEMQQQDERNINSIMSKFINSINGIAGNTDKYKVIKFFSGAWIWIILVIYIPFTNTFKKNSDKIITMGMMALVGVTLGCIGMKLPIVFHPAINFFCFPILQIIILICVFNRQQNNNG